MDEARVVRVLQAGTGLHAELDRLVGAELAAFRKRPPRDVLHHDEGPPFVFPCVVDLRDVRM